MPTTLENLQTTKSNIAALLVELTTNPKPTYSIDGQVVSWSEYFQMLTGQMKALNELINSEEPAEVRLQGYS